MPFVDRPSINIITADKNLYINTSDSRPSAAVSSLAHLIYNKSHLLSIPELMKKEKSVGAKAAP
jgi:hypothetical protein